MFKNLQKKKFIDQYKPLQPKYTQYEIELYISDLNFQNCVPHAEYYSSYICSHSYVEIKYLEEDKAATGQPTYLK